MSVLKVIAMALLLTLAGCEKSQDQGPTAPKPPPRRSWKANTLSFAAVPGEATFALSTGATEQDDAKPLVLEVRCREFLKDTKIEIGSTSGTVSGGGEYEGRLDVRERVGKLGISDAIGGKADLDLKVTITVPGYEPVIEKLPSLEMGPALAYALSRAPDYGMSFKDEPAADGPPKSVAILGPPSSKRQIRVVGPAERVWDIDWIALEERSDTSRDKRCTGYSRRIDVVLKMFDSTIKVFDRRTGKPLKDKAFEAPGQCPKNPLLNPDGSTLAYVLYTDVDAWLRGELGLKKK